MGSFEVENSPPAGDSGPADDRREDASGKSPQGASELLRLLEQDRHWIATELHDGPVQYLTSAQMHLESLLSGGKLPEGPVREAVVKTAKLLREAVEEARRIVLGLRHPSLEEKGVVGAVKCFLASQAGLSPKIRFKADVAFRRFDEALETAIYRIVQEGVTNIRRHSKAERAEVRIAQIAERLEISIQDWGVGFDPARVRTESFGLKGIVERARLLGGSARIDSEPGKGTRIDVVLPLSGFLG